MMLIRSWGRANARKETNKCDKFALANQRVAARKFSFECLQFFFHLHRGIAATLLYSHHLHLFTNFLFAAERTDEPRLLILANNLIKIYFVNLLDDVVCSLCPSKTFFSVQFCSKSTRPEKKREGERERERKIIISWCWWVQSAQLHRFYIIQYLLSSFQFISNVFICAEIAKERKMKERKEKWINSQTDAEWQMTVDAASANFCCFHYVEWTMSLIWIRAFFFSIAFVSRCFLLNGSDMFSGSIEFFETFQRLAGEFIQFQNRW